MFQFHNLPFQTGITSMSIKKYKRFEFHDQAAKQMKQICFAATSFERFRV
ncbi:hypothetical protein HMPREF9370_2217 [Neisseria wadsworthii 9715]|uniref:Uncharacterized protein n=1 Tax=Neisseria wadsworthii 9715 TaxID=1030841 RepID=G4CT07_9NEIS|nr:hypothetical protein HMPREF9370_2217 [Neisseria wadsworthii 9715]